MNQKLLLIFIGLVLGLLFAAVVQANADINLVQMIIDTLGM
jgi:hypothetical protein